MSEESRLRTGPTTADARVVLRARQLFHVASEHVDGHYRLQLDLARHNVLRDLRSDRFRYTRRLGVVTAAAATCALVIGLGWQRFAAVHSSEQPEAGAAVVSPAPGGDENLVGVADEPVEMVQELSFYRWLAAQKPTRPKSTDGGR